MELVQKLLLDAIAGESSAEARYKGYANKAGEEGFGGVATLFTTLSRAESIHIANHTRALGKNGFSGTVPQATPDHENLSTMDNLSSAIAAEYEEFRKMYPSFRRRIQSRYGNNFAAKIALLSIRWACESEANHYTLLKQAMEVVASGDDMIDDFYLCSVCGNIHYSTDPPDKLCPVCGHDLSFYTLVSAP